MSSAQLIFSFIAFLLLPLLGCFADNAHSNSFLLLEPLSGEAFRIRAVSSPRTASSSAGGRGRPLSADLEPCVSLPVLPPALGKFHSKDRFFSPGKWGCSPFSPGVLVRIKWSDTRETALAGVAVSVSSGVAVSQAALHLAGHCCATGRGGGGQRCPQ